MPALLLREPGPVRRRRSNSAFEAALRAPDHGALQPWRCVLIRGEARARLAELLVARMRERDAGIPPRQNRQGATHAAGRAAGDRRRRPRTGARHKVPELEQLLSTGAAVMNLLNAFHAQGYGAIWLTGANAYDPEIAQALGFGPDERCLGFVYVGSLPSADAPPRRLDRASAVREWAG